MGVWVWVCVCVGCVVWVGGWGGQERWNGVMGGDEGAEGCSTRPRRCCRKAGLPHGALAGAAQPVSSPRRRVCPAPPFTHPPTHPPTHPRCLPQARMTCIEDFRPRFSYSRNPGGIYTVWVYPSPEQGPRSGKHPLLVYHK